MGISERLNEIQTAQANVERKRLAGVQTKPTSKGNLVFDTNRWQHFLYTEECRENTQLVANIGAGAEKAPRFNDFQREVFARMFSPTTKRLDKPAAGSEWAQKLHELADGLPEFKQLQSRCKNDEMWSGIATGAVGKTIISKMQQPSDEHKEREVEKHQERIETLKQMGEQGVDVAGRLEKAAKQLAQAEQDAKDQADGLNPTEIRNALRVVCKGATEEINGEEEAIQALGYGSSGGAPAFTNDMKQKREIANMIRNNPTLKRIAEVAGRMRRIAVQKQRSKSTVARDEVTDIEQGADLARLLPSELVDLGRGGDRELLFYQRLIERKCLQYKLAGKEREGRGPIVMLLDVSSSMRGKRDVLAKATCLGLLDICKREKRTGAIVLFNQTIQHTAVFQDGVIDHKLLIETLTCFTGGGTAFEQPLKHAAGVILSDRCMKKADILLITDGASDTSPEFDAYFAEFKKAHAVSVYTVLVGGSTEVVERWTDHVFRMEDILDGASGERGRFENTLYSM